MRFLPFLLGLALTPVAAQSIRVDVDAERSRVGFRLGATLHAVEGRFVLLPAELRLDPSGGMRGLLVVPAVSGRTGNGRRDRKMHEKVLESTLHPEIVFEPTSYTGGFPATGSATLEVRGELALHGVRRELSIPVEVVLDGDEVRARAEFRVPYVEWGLDDPSSFLLRVAKHVDVEVELVGRLSVAPAPHGGPPSAPDSP